MPALYVLGGANGVGKTTWYQWGIENKSINPELPFINIDLIVLRELGGYTTLFPWYE
jgi:predicted ABC-type ATPase